MEFDSHSFIDGVFHLTILEGILPPLNVQEEVEWKCVILGYHRSAILPISFWRNTIDSTVHSTILPFWEVITILGRFLICSDMPPFLPVLPPRYLPFVLYLQITVRILEGCRLPFYRLFVFAIRWATATTWGVPAVTTCHTTVSGVQVFLRYRSAPPAPAVPPLPFGPAVSPAVCRYRYYRFCTVYHLRWMRCLPLPGFCRCVHRFSPATTCVDLLLHLVPYRYRAPFAWSAVFWCLPHFVDFVLPFHASFYRLPPPACRLPFPPPPWEVMPLRFLEHLPAC